MTPQPYFNSLPVALRRELNRPPRTGKPLEPAAVELLARYALELGANPKGPVLAYVARRLRYALGAGDFPSPPSLTAAEGAYIDRRLTDVIPALERAVAELRNANDPPAPRLHIDPTGYTNPEQVAPPPDVVDLDEARRRRRQQDPAA